MSNTVLESPKLVTEARGEPIQAFPSGLSISLSISPRPVAAQPVADARRAAYAYKALRASHLFRDARSMEATEP